MKSALKRADFTAAIIRHIGTVLLAIFGLGGLSTEAHAQFATGGTGLHRNSIFWVSWGNAGENVFAGRTITRNFYVGSPTPENLLAVTCTLSNAVAAQGASALNVYTPGNWQGDGLDDLYNIGGNHPGTGANPNTLRSGLATASGSTVEFDFNCSATLGGDPFPLRGLVFADAEASGGSEFVAAQLTSGGVIRIIDQISQCGSASTVTVNGSEVRLGGPTSPQVSCENNANPGLRAGPALVGFIDGATSARVIARGGGVSAVAVGAVLDVEFSEALPSSFGTAASHILEPVWNGGVATSGVNYNNPANLAVRDPGIRLGATVVSDQGTEPIGGSDVDALPKTTGAQGAGYADVLPPSGTPGSSYQISNVACIGPGNVAGWIDFDGNGAFDADERSNTASCPSGSGNVALSWNLPADFVAQATSYMRLRIAAPSDALPQATGLAVDGEAEDYRIDLVPARLTLVKTVVNDDGRTAVPADFVLHAIGPSTVSGASGSSQVTNAAVNAGSYVLSEDNLPGYTASQFSCVVNGGAAVIGNALTLAEGDAAVCTITNDDTASPDISVEKTANPAAGATVVAGQTITYTLTVTVANAATSQPVTLADALGAGLSFGAVTSAGPFICSGALNCELPAGTVPGSYSVSYTATVDAAATGTVANAVTATNPAGGDPDPSCVSCTIAHQVQPTYALCTPQNSIFNIVNGVNIWRFSTPSGPDVQVAQLTAPVAGDLNGLMLDKVRNRLLFVSRAGSNTILWAYDAANGGWYQAAAPFASPDFPRAGMNANGIGFLIAGGTNTPQVWRVTADPAPGSFGYTVQLMGNLSYDVAPTNTSSGDIAFDADGVAWLSSGEDLYTVDLSAGSLSATRRTKPLLNGNPSTIQWAGVAFGADGRLYLANNAAPSAYYAYDPATGVVSQVASTGAGGARDLASCAFPDIAQPELSVTKSLAEVNGAAYTSGAPVQPGDTLSYRITIANDGGAVATLFPGDVDETIPSNTSFVAAGNDFACSGATCSNGAALNIPANGGTATLDFVVQVADPLNGTVANITNAVSVQGIDCAAAGNDCTETTPLGATISVSKSADPATGSSVSAGNTINYTLTVTVANAATSQPLALVDTLDADLTFGAVTNAGSFICSGALNCELPAGTAPGSYALTYSATVDADATGTVGNSVAATNPPGGDPDPVCATCTTEHVVTPVQLSVAKSANPAPGTPVVPGSSIAYTLAVTVTNSATTEALTLTDTLEQGLTFGSVTNAGVFSCTGALSCVLPAGTVPGTYQLTYVATVDAGATGTVGNGVAATNPPGGDPDPVCATCTTEHPILDAAISVAKSSDPATGANVAPGDTINYTLTVTVTNSATTQPLTLTDTLGEGLNFGAVTNAGAFTCSGSLSCTLPAGTLPGSYALTYAARVDADATGTIRNGVTATNPAGGDPDPICTTCATEHQVVPAAITVSKTSDPASGTAVAPGDTISYTLAVTVANAATTQPLTLTDTLGEGLSFGAVTNAGVFTCSGSLSCTLPAGTLPGAYQLVYTATVDTDATTSVGNVVTATSPPGGDPDPVCASCTTRHSIVAAAVSVAKSANPATGTTVLPGDTISYTIAVTVANSATTEPVTLTDTLGQGLSFEAVADAGVFACSGSLSCTLPAGTLPGAYQLTYTARVDAGATGVLANRVTATNPAGGDPDPVCTSCATEHRVLETQVRVGKAADIADGAEVRAGQEIAYRLTVTVENSATTEPVTLTDALGQGLSFGAVTNAGVFACAGSLSCTLPAGTLPGTYQLAYTATVDADATSTVRNMVTATNPPGGDPDPICGDCTVEHRLMAARIVLAKTSNPGAGAEVHVGDTLEYSLTVTVENAATTQPVTLTDTPDAGLTIGALPQGCTINGTISCVLPAGTVPGRYSFAYPATVNADASTNVGNAVVGDYPAGGSSVECASCATSHRLADAASLRIVKSTTTRDVKVGDLVRYTLTVENVGLVNVADAIVVDTPPAGFSYVADSMSVVDRDGAFTLGGNHPLRIGGIDILAGGKATIVYLLRVGAGVRSGAHVNEAVAQGTDGTILSNVATAQVTLESDPLLEDSLIFGTVFDDRDGDGWQDSARLSGVRVRGGFAPSAYIAGSTTLDRGNGPVPVADASAPLLHGIDLDVIVGGEQLVIRQRLSRPDVTGDLVLTSAQGITLGMDMAGAIRAERAGEAAKGLTAAQPVIVRKLEPVDGGWELVYTIANHGVDERGIAGVRIASVEGLLVETDQFGRYHLVDIPGGGDRGRNFILKVDPATLPGGSRFTTRNPLVRRITPGIPVRFDFGVRLPSDVLSDDPPAPTAAGRE